MTPTQRAAMEQALSALEIADNRDGVYSWRPEMVAFRAALAETAPVQEPVAWWKQYPDGSISVVESRTFLAEDAVAMGWRALGFTDVAPQAQQPAPPADVPMIEQKAVEPVGFVNRAAVNSAIIDRARGVGDTHTWSEKKTSFHSVPFYTSPQPAPHADVPMLTDEELREAFAQNLSDTYVCSRVWIAWSYGTMSEDDFSPASECDELLDSLVQAVRQKAGLK